MMQSSVSMTNAVDSPDKPTLMIVDDERNFAESLRLAIEDAYTVLVAGSLKSAREILRNGIPAAILLDLRLPDGEGVELFRVLKDLSRMPVVIVMTAYSTAESFEKAMKAGAADYFVKPLDVEKLKIEIGKRLAKC